MSSPFPAPHRPRVRAASNDGRTPPETQDLQAAGTRAQTLQGAAVLLVEDDPPSLRLLQAMLRVEGCDVRSATSAEEALFLLRTFRPSLIVIDLILPLMSGLLLAQRLKADPSTQDIALVAATAFNGPAVERVALATGFCAYVRKPIDPNAFCELLRATLEGKL
jgi:CheY-like chemotaxis protein